MRNKNSNPNENLLNGFLFVLFLAPVICMQVWISLQAVWRLGSNGVSLSVIAGLIAVTILCAGVLESALLKLPIGRCLKEALAVGWAFLPPSMFLFFWNLPKQYLSNAFIIAFLVLCVWWFLFWFVFSKNKR